MGEALNAFSDPDDQPHYVAVDTETTGVGFYDTPFCATVAWQTFGGISSYFLDLANDDDWADLTIILTEAPVLVFHNAKFDLQKLKLAGLYEWRTRESDFSVEDTAIMAHLINEHGSKRLKELAKTLLGIEPLEETALNAKFRELKLKKSEGYHKLPLEVLKPYALKDAEYTIGVFNALHPLMNDHRQIYRLEQELMFALLAMEERGQRVNVGYLDESISEYRSRFLDDTIELRKLAKDDSFNPNSPQQVMAVLLQSGISIDSTSVETLEQHKETPLVAKLLSFRNTQKILRTYLENLREMQKDGLLHPSFNSGNTRTGRLSSSA